MKKILIYMILLVVTVLQVNAQQQPQISQFHFNKFLLNPAIAGSMNGAEFRVKYRKQWMNFPGAPQTAYMSFHGNIKKHGLGLFAFHDQTGPTQRVGAQLAHAYHLKINDKSKLSFGIAGRIVKWSVTSDINFNDPTNTFDPAVAQARDGVWVGDAIFGMYYYHEKFNIGLSIPNLIESEIDFNRNEDQDDREQFSKLYRHYYLHGSYKFEFKKSTLEPVVLLKKVDATKVEFDAGFRYHFLEDQLTVGASYRNVETIVFMLGAKLDNFRLMYSYDYSHGDIQDYSFGSNEITVGYDFIRTKKEPKVILTP